MSRRRIFFRSLLVDTVFFGIIHSVLSFVLFVIFRDSRLTVAALLLAVPFAAMSFTRRKMDVLPLFVGLHIALVIWPLWLPVDIIARILAVFSLFLAAIYSFFIRLRPKWELDFSTTSVLLALLAILTILAHAGTFEAAALPASLWALVVVAAYLAYMQTTRVDTSMDILSDSARNQISTILRFNNGLMAVFMLPVLAAGIAALLLPLNGVARAIGYGAVALLGGLFSLLANLPNSVESANEVAGGSVDNLYSQLAGANAGPPWWYQKLEEIFMFLVQVAIVLGIFVALGYALLRLYRRLHEPKSTGGDILESILPELALEDLPGLFQRLRSRLPTFGWDERERIRRNYFRKVRGHIRKGVTVRPADTAGQIAEKIRPAEDIGGLTATYNRARYGSEK